MAFTAISFHKIVSKQIKKNLRRCFYSINDCPAPCISNSCIKIKINLNFIFTLFCGASKSFKPFKAPQKCENKISLLVRDWDGKG